jgi:hypothetical protein
MKFRTFAWVAGLSGILLGGVSGCGGGAEPGAGTESAGLPVPSPRLVEDTVVAAADATGGPGAASAPACGVSLVATLVFQGSRRIDGTASLAQPMPFAVPAAIPVTAGGTKNGHAQLQFSTGGGAPVTCSYDLQGGGQSFPFTSCDDGAGPGGLESADSFVLHIQTADHGAGASGTSIQLTAVLDAPDGTVCPGSDRCFQAYACQAGTCTGSNPVVCTALDQCHVAGTCDPSSAICSNPPAPDGNACNDGNGCDLNDTCVAGVCTAGGQVSCAASDACHVPGICQPRTGQCSNPPGNDGAACGSSAGSICNRGACDSGCSIGGQFHYAGEANPGDLCQSCQPDTSTTDWTSAADGTSCFFSSTNNGICQSGACLACGASGQACCGYDGASSCYQSTCENGTCQCGGQNQQCCGGNTCGANLECLTVGTVATCQCGAEVQPCCGGTSCGPNLVCGEAYENAQFQPVYLCSCGRGDEPCCGGNYCDASSYCSNGMCILNGN